MATCVKKNEKIRICLVIIVLELYDKTLSFKDCILSVNSSLKRVGRKTLTKKERNTILDVLRFDEFFDTTCNTVRLSEDGLRGAESILVTYMHHLASLN